MTERAAHLIDSVLPDTPVRQWVLSLPIQMRYLIAYDARLCSKILNAFIREVFRWYRRYAKEYAGLNSMSEPRCGSVTFIQRAGSALNLNVHFHALVLDGVYLHQGWAKPLSFLVLPAPRTIDVENILLRVRKRVMAILEAYGHFENGRLDELSLNEPLLASCTQSSLRSGTSKKDEPPPLERCADFDYFSLHANTRVRASERKRLEKLCRYVARPPVSNQLLVELNGERVGYKLKRPWSDGTTMVVFKPHDFIQRLASMVPPPRSHQVRYHGVLASASSLRSFVVPNRPRNPLVRRRTNYCWAELMKRAFEIDVLECPQCKGPMRLIACIMERKAIREILGTVGMPGDSP